MTADQAAWLTRAHLPDGFERWEMTIPAGHSLPTAAEEWAGALVRVETGTLEVECLAGGHETFHAGDLLALGWLPVVELRNVGEEQLRLLAVRRDSGSPLRAGRGR